MERERGIGTKVLSIAAGLALLAIGCGGGGGGSCDVVTDLPFGALSESDVRQVIAQAAAHATDRGAAVTIAVADRMGNPLGIFRMSASSGSADLAYLNARTAAFFSTNGNAFNTRTASFIIQDFYPPGIPNTTAGPLFGVQFSSLRCSDIQRNGAAFVTGPTGLSAFPGSAPLYLGRIAAGGIGVTGSGDSLLDEEIAAAGAFGFAAPGDLRADTIILDGFRLPFFEAREPGSVVARDVPGTFTVPPRGTVSTTFAQRNLGGVVVDEPIPIRGGSALSADEVARILQAAAERGLGTRAAIRKCGSMRMNVAVVDVDGSVLGVIRLLDAPIFGFDVSVQKARTALAFSDPARPLGREIRDTIGRPQGSALAVSTRAVGFLSQISYPPGVTGNDPGPLRGRQEQLSATCAPFGNGITIFPGGIPLYRGGALVGAIGVSGDGIEQDEIVARSGAEIGFEAPEGIRTDAFEFRGTRLPYTKEPRNPGEGL